MKFKYEGEEAILTMDGKNVVDNEGIALTKGTMFYPVVKNTRRIPVQARMGERAGEPVVMCITMGGMSVVVDCARYFSDIPEGFLRGEAPRTPERPLSFREQIQNAATDEELTAIARRVQAAEKLSPGTMRRLTKLFNDRGLQVRYNG